MATGKKSSKSETNNESRSEGLGIWKRRKRDWSRKANRMKRVLDREMTLEWRERDLAMKKRKRD